MREVAMNLESKKATRLWDEIKRLREMELDTLKGERAEYAHLPSTGCRYTWTQSNSRLA